MFYNNILSYCEKRGISPSKLLSDLGISKAGLKRWREGTEPTNRTKKMIADYFGITVEDLVTEIEKPAAPKGDELKGIDLRLANLLRDLTPEEADKVRAFIAGMKA